MTAAASLPGVVQTVLTGTIKPNAAAKLRAFGLDRLFDLEIGGYGSDAYPRGSLLLLVRGQAGDKYGTPVSERRQPSTSPTPSATSRQRNSAALGASRSAPAGNTLAELRDAGADLVLPDLSDTEQVISAIDRLTRVPAGR